MKREILGTLAILFAGAQALAQNLDGFYKLGPDSLQQEGVPHGKMVGPHTLPCDVYPGTAHTFWVYVPAQYDPSKPASLMVFNDGQAFKNETGDIRAQNVIDNLIHRREIPVMIAVFINPGKTPEQPEPSPREWGDRSTNRPTEYNTPDDKYATIICDELLPALNRDYNISANPEQRGIGGASSGAIAAFSVAWERPDQFRKVLSIVGSFVNLRGGDVYPERVLASERKPIRLFFQDGRNDNRGVGRRGEYDPRRDWFLQNVRLVDALTKKDYDVNYVWGIGLHGTKQGGAILPDMMRWLWRDHPASVDVRDEVERALNRPTAQADEPPKQEDK
ncbi:MAG TPA: alpha/beta hydrolase-fold protein [Pirellulales bacterium]|nr:alpha/beta hydrolase-fold protein [Pirellulales bacterium]